MKRLLRDNVLVKVEEDPGITSSGLFIPLDSRKRNLGSVVMIGPGTRDRPVHLSVGDKVQFITGSGFDLDYNGSPHKILRGYTDVIMRIDG